MDSSRHRRVKMANEDRPTFGEDKAYIALLLGASRTSEQDPDWDDEHISHFSYKGQRQDVE